MSFIKNKIVEDDILDIINSDLDWNKLSNKKVLITGANGFLGKYLVATLLKLNEIKNSNISVIATVRKNNKNSWIQNLDNNGFNLKIIRCDLGKEIPEIDDDLSYIMHAASQASPKFYEVDPVGTILPNVVGTNNLLTKFHRSKNREGFIFISSSEVYGDTYNIANLSELDMGIIDPMNIRSCYSESKRCGENLCASWNHQFNIPTKVIRPFHTYGPGLREDDGRVFAEFAYNIFNNKNIQMQSDGLSRRSFCYVSDAIKGIFNVTFNGKSSEAYNLANPNGDMSIKELAFMLVDLFPEKNLQVDISQKIKSLNQDQKFNESLPNIEKISELGWVPQISPEDGFFRMIKSLEQKFN